MPDLKLGHSKQSQADFDSLAISELSKDGQRKLRQFCCLPLITDLKGQQTRTAQEACPRARGHLVLLFPQLS